MTLTKAAVVAITAAAFIFMSTSKTFERSALKNMGSRHITLHDLFGVALLLFMSASFYIISGEIR